MWSDYWEMMQVLLDRCAMFGIKVRFLQTKLGLGENWMALGNVYRIGDCIGLAI